MLSRNETLRIGYEAAEIDHIPFKVFKDSMAQWHVKPVMVSGEVAGMFVSKGSHVHFCILPEFRGRWASRKTIRELLLPLLKTFGFITTSVPDNKPYGHRLVKRWGCYEIGRGTNFTKYKLKDLKWV
jgi:hypothetical protein